MIQIAHLNIFQIEAENAELKASNDGFVENSKLLASKNNDLQTKVDELLKELSRIRDQEEYLRYFFVPASNNFRTNHGID